MPFDALLKTQRDPRGLKKNSWAILERPRGPT